jgi:prevent-host-death family protein
MPDREPLTQTMNATDVRRNWSRILNRVFRREARVIIEKRGIPVAALISARDLERLQELEAQRARRFAALDEVGAAFKDVPADELEREVANAISEVRAERRAERPQEGAARRRTR